MTMKCVNGQMIEMTAEEKAAFDASNGGLAQIKAEKWEAIKAERDRRQSAGVKVAVNGVDKWFHSDVGSRIQLMGLKIMGPAVPGNLQWKTMDGTFVTMTEVLSAEIFNAAASNEQTIFAIGEQHKAAMEASANPMNYDFSTGWPPVYGE